MKRQGMMRGRGSRDPQERRPGSGHMGRGGHHGDAAPQGPESRAEWREGRGGRHEYRGEAPPQSESRGEGREGREHRHERGGQEEGRRGGRGERGWRGRGGPRAGRGDVRAAVLMLLADQPLHGYELIQQITARSGGAWRPSPGSVYPALQLLEDQGLIRGEETEGRRVYQLTEAGRTHIEQHRDELAQAWAGVTAGEDDPARELRDLFEQLGGAVRQVVHAATETQISAARDVLSSARRQLYRILADEPVGGTPPDTGSN